MKRPSFGNVPTEANYYNLYGVNALQYLAEFMFKSTLLKSMHDPKESR